MKVIDFEMHYYTKDFLTTLDARSEIPTFNFESGVISYGGDANLSMGPLIPTLMDLGEKRIAEMDRAGVDLAVLSSACAVELMEAGAGSKEAIKMNNEVYQAVQKYPDRYRGYAMLAFDEVEESVKEMERCVKELGFVGWNAFSNGGTLQIDDDKYFPLFEKAAELGIFVYIHPSCPYMKEFHGFGSPLLSSGLGFALDTLITVSRMIYKGVFDRLPDLKIMLGHLGEGFSFFMERFNQSTNLYMTRTPKEKWQIKNEKMPGEYFKSNIWVSTSGKFSKSTFESAKAILGADRIVFGSDFPMENLPAAVRLVEDQNLTVGEAKRIFYENAIETFGIEI